MTSLFPRFLGDAPAMFGILSGAMNVCVFAIGESIKWYHETQLKQHPRDKYLPILVPQERKLDAWEDRPTPNCLNHQC